MPTRFHSRPMPHTLPTLLLLALFAAACGQAPTPVLQVETQLQTVEVTREVTRLVEVEVPVTVTPSPTPEISLTPSLSPTITRTPSRTVSPTITRTPSRTSTPEPPVVTVLVHAGCYFGPSSAYLWFYGLNETSWMEVIGRSPSNPNTDPKDIYLFVQGVHGWNPCWVKAEFVRFNDGRTLEQHTEIPIQSYSRLPLSTLYRGPTNAEAIREGSKVSIVWSTIWMTEDDYRGYLVEAWLCQDGQLTFTPLHWQPSLQVNNGVGYTGINVTDEPGCLQPSSARLYAAEKHGYTGFLVIPWPPYVEPAASPSPSPTP